VPTTATSRIQGKSSTELGDGQEAGRESTLNQPFAVRGQLAIGGVLEAGAVVVDEDRIVEVLRSPRTGDLPSHVIDTAIVAPGLIDLQVNGGFGVEVGPDPGALLTLARRLPESGVTTYLPTLISSSATAYRTAFAAFEAFMGTGEAQGAQALGFHLEGPFLSPTRKGAHSLAAIEQADGRLFDELLESRRLRLMTLAPERSGGLERIRHLRQRGFQVSLGHTDASLEEFTAGVDAGAEMATHLYNAMSPFGHRTPGSIGGALTDDRLTVGLIADGIHCHAASLRLAVRAKGTERIALVTDMMAAAGMPAGTYTLGGQTVLLDDQAARLEDGTLAGAVVFLDEAIRNMVHWAGVTPAEAISMATEVPARLLGMKDRGRIITGGRADLALLDEDLTVAATIISGRQVYHPTGTRASDDVAASLH
jgi:N-acetylglucosamine-6-phosphate deacetylase